MILYKSPSFWVKIIPAAGNLSKFKSGKIFVCQNQNEIIGFSASIPLSKEPTLSELLSSKGINTKDITYFAELGVSEKFRKKGIGKKLTQSLLDSTGNQSAILRTSENNIKAISLYQKIGFQKLPVVQEVSQMRTNGETVSDRRVFYIFKKNYDSQI